MPECLGSKRKRFGAGVRLAGLLFRLQTESQEESWTRLIRIGGLELNKFKKLTRDQRKWRTAVIMLLPALVSWLF